MPFPSRAATSHGAHYGAQYGYPSPYAATIPNPYFGAHPPSHYPHPYAPPHLQPSHSFGGPPTLVQQSSSNTPRTPMMPGYPPSFHYPPMSPYGPYPPMYGLSHAPSHAPSPADPRMAPRGTVFGYPPPPMPHYGQMRRQRSEVPILHR